MRASLATAAALFAACVRAIQVTAPAKNQTVDLAAGFKVTWNTVSTDPTSAHLFLVNQAGGHTPYSKDLGAVDLTKGSFTVTLKGVPDDTGYQFNIQSVEPLNTGILAQSQQFEVKSSGDKATTSSSTSSSASSSVTLSISTSASSAAAGSAETTLSSTTKAGASPSASKTTTGSTVSQTAAAPATKAVQGGSLLALVIGLVAVVA